MPYNYQAFAAEDDSGGDDSGGDDSGSSSNSDDSGSGDTTGSFATPPEDTTTTPPEDTTTTPPEDTTTTPPEDTTTTPPAGPQTCPDGWAPEPSGNCPPSSPSIAPPPTIDTSPPVPVETRDGAVNTQDSGKEGDDNTPPGNVGDNTSTGIGFIPFSPTNPSDNKEGDTTEQGEQTAVASKETDTNNEDGFQQGVKDANRDLKGLNGHGFDDSCPKGHTGTFCEGYKDGYNERWNDTPENDS